MDKRKFPMLLSPAITPEVGAEIVERMPFSAVPEDASVGYMEGDGDGCIYFYGTQEQFNRYRDGVRGLAMGMLLILLSREVER